jgi:hypothetical protein
MDMLMLKIVTYGKQYWWIGYGLAAVLLLARAC